MDEAPTGNTSINFEKDANILIFYAFLEYNQITNLALLYYMANKHFCNKNKKATNEQEHTMMTELYAAIRRSSDRLIADAAGAAAIVTILFVGLHWPQIF